MPPRLQDLRTVLFLEYMLPLGYLVHMTPVFEAIKRARPELTIAVATRGPGLEVLAHSPFVDHLLDTPDPLHNLPATVLSLRRQLRALSLKPDCCLTGTADQRTRFALLAALATSGWRGGFTVHPALYQRPLTYDRTLSRLHNNLRLAGLLGAAPEPAPEPRVFFSAGDLSHSQTLLPESPQPTLAVIAANSGGLPTAWLPERWAEVIRHAHTLGYRVIYVGAPRDAAVVRQVQALADGLGTSAAGRTTIPQLAALLARCDLAVTLDTGAMHVCRAVGTPMVVLGLAWQRPLEWLASGREHIRILRRPAPDAEEPRTPEYRLQEHTAADVIAALKEMTQRYPATFDARQRRLHASLRQR